MLRIRELRLENNLTQKELAEKISSTSKNIWAYENQISILHRSGNTRPIGL